MRRLPAVLLLLALLASAAVVTGQPAGGQAGEGACAAGHVEVRGIVRDAATGLPLQEVTSVEYEPLGAGTPADGDATNSASRYSVCLLPDTYQFTFRADSYRVDEAAGLEVVVTGDGPIIHNINLTPKGRVIAGRVTNMAGASRFASIGIFRRNAAGNWIGIDGIGNDMPSGKWSFRVPSFGRYRVSACVDYHWCRFATSATRLRFGRTIVVDASTVFINDVDIKVPYCPATPDFCVPPGFNS